MTHYYKWLTDHKARLFKHDGESGDVAIEQVETGYKIYGRYTAHDHYMGHPYSDNLVAVIKLLKKEHIEYTLIEHTEMTLENGYFQVDTFIELSKEAYKALKQFIK